MANAIDRKQIELAEQQAQRREQQRRADLKALLDLHAGRRVLSWIIGYLQPRAQMWNANAAITGFHATQSDVANWLKDRIEEIDPDALLLMHTESRAQEKQDELERKALAANRRDKPALPVNVNETDEREGHHG